MYLSKLYINIGDKKIVYHLEDSNFWHKRIMEGFREYEATPKHVREELGVLFRLNKTDKDFIIYVQSKVEPNWYGLSWVKKADYKNIDNLIESFKEGMVLNFECLCLPYYTDENRKLHSIQGYDKKISWFLEKSKYNGFLIKDNDIRLEYCSEKFTNIGGNKNISFYASLFKGRFIISDLNKFTEFYKTGVGREKAYGAGMILLY